MVYDKEYYEKNKDKFAQWAKEYREKNRDKVNETRKKWRHGKGKELNRLSKQRTDSKYHNKMKSDPEYLRKRRENATEYNNRPEVKAHRKKIQSKHRAKPEVKKQNAKYNKRWAEENPDKVLINIKRGLKKFDDVMGLSWTTFHSQLKGWAKIIQQDCNEKCQVCGGKSTQAHHIIHKTLYPHLAFNRSNGIALCDQCHYEVHGKMLV